jgi:hypothetical protein
VRVTALWGHPPSEATPLAELRAAILTLPLRAVPPFAGVYVARRGADPAVLARGLAGARQEGQVELAARLEAVMNRGAGAAADADGGADGGELADASTDTPSDAAAGGGDVAADTAGQQARAPKAQMPAPADLPGWLVSGPTVEGRFLPLARAHPEMLADASGVARLVDLMLAEDPTSTEVLELAAATFGRLGRFGGTERMLGELVYQTPDRAAGLARAARVWEHLGRTREACVQWLRAARWRDDAEDPTWHTALACARREPGVADWREIRAYVIARARPDRRAAITATLDAL